MMIILLPQKNKIIDCLNNEFIKGGNNYGIE